MTIRTEEFSARTHEKEQKIEWSYEELEGLNSAN